MSDRPRLLLIDPDPLVRRTLADMLESVGDVIALAPEQARPDGVDVVVAAAGTKCGGQALVPLIKPIRASALLAAIDAALARRRTDAAIFIGPWRLDPGKRCLDDDHGHRIRLTDKESAILVMLAKADGMVSRQDMLADIWGYGAQVTTHTLETHIYRLRRKIEVDSDQITLLLTEPGGYRLRSSSDPRQR